MALFRSLGSRHTLNFPVGFSTVTKGFNHFNNRFAYGFNTSNLIMRSTSDLSFSRRAMGTLLAGEMVKVTSGFIDIWWVFGREPIFPKQSLNSAKKFGESSCIILFTR